MGSVANAIFDRMERRFGIDMKNHINGGISEQHNTDAGFYFRPKNSRALIDALKATGKFRLDDRDHLLDAVASLVTTGKGYREIVKKGSGLHFQIANNEAKSNVHIDATAFVCNGPWGPHFNANLIQHTIVDLGWKHYVVGGSYALWTPMGKVLDGVKLTVPNLDNKMKKYGIGYQVKLGKSINLRIDHKRTLKSLKSPTDFLSKSYYTNVKEKRTMFTLGGSFDENSWFR